MSDQNDNLPTRVQGGTISIPGASPQGNAGLPKLGRYEVLELVGVGGMGMVYRGRDPSLDRSVAIKLVLARDGEHDDAARLLREARALALVHHVNVVPVYDVDIDGDRIYLVMPFFDGGTLRTWLRSEPRTWGQILERYLAAGRGVCAAHGAGLVHRDFKPDNVLLDKAGHVYVADFGLARPSFDGPPSTESAMLVHITTTGAVAGTPRYMAPEQLAAGPVDAQCDQFAFAVALWEALFDVHPFDIDRGADKISSVELVRRIGAGPSSPSTPHSIPPKLVAALRRALSVLPEARWPKLADLLDVLAVRRTRWVVRWTGVALLAIAAIAAITTITGTDRTNERLTEPVGDGGLIRDSNDAPSKPVENPDGTRELTVTADFDAARFDPMVFVPEARRLAKRMFEDAELASMYISFVSPDGRVDLRLTTDDHPVEYSFVSATAKPRPGVPRGVPYPCAVLVRVQPDKVVVRSLTDLCKLSTASPKCSPREIWQRMIASGVPRDAVTTLGFYGPLPAYSGFDPVPAQWQRFDDHGHGTFHLYNDDCH